ncbi:MULTISPECIES: hypothetical protein [Pantoea]|jgi:hypothetical protein|uniref:Uncharacterized protein n=1 Tax=Pantoea brenneri TaxID=472694 RepID=A0A7Y6TTL1_9GAMM|nr:MULTISPECIES: hypothetical protein [Pantoea]MBZ6396998.1 hypothetical protein [Pantoea sp.]MBZ6440251.1 hypothetical protein [Pantoea sp.]NUY43485.1 hypothetical protein [Pantoea brenneri]NUY50949.1 hypothetical protein [Pantoea brenneri]NUY61320.1 hypothetical protein [Pantoea brenneri]
MARLTDILTALQQEAHFTVWYQACIMTDPVPGFTANASDYLRELCG